MDKEINYSFQPVDKCEMCGDDTSSHKVLGQRLNKSQGLRPLKKTGIAVTVNKCRNCGLIYSKPLPVPGNIQDHYGIRPEDYWIPAYFKWTPDYFAYQINIAKKLIQFQSGAKALDIGAGIGKSIISLEKAGFDAYGIEPSKPFFERAVTAMNINKERLKPATIEEATYENNYFDFITFGAVFEHLHHPAQALEKALRWLKPEGIVHIEVPSASYLLSKVINFYYRLIGSNYVTNISPMHEPFHYYEFSLKSFQELSKRLDYEIVFHEYYVCDILQVPKLFHPLLRKYMKMTKTGMQLTVWLKKKS